MNVRIHSRTYGARGAVMTLPARVLLGSVATLTCACSAYGVTTSNTPAVAPFGVAGSDQAEVCVFRAGAPSPLYTITVYDNGKLVGATREGTYFCYFAEPGRHAIVSDGTYGARAAELNAVGGRHYYLKQEWLFPAIRGHELSWIDPAAVQEDLQDEQYAMLTEVPADQALPGSRPFARAR